MNLATEIRIVLSKHLLLLNKFLPVQLNYSLQNKITEILMHIFFRSNLDAKFYSLQVKCRIYSYIVVE